MNGTVYHTPEEWLDAQIAKWRVQWLKAIDEFLRPGVKV